MTPEQAKFFAATLGQQLQSEWMTTYKVLNAIPEGKKDWKPETHARTAWELATHIASVDVGFLQGVHAGSFANGYPDPKAATVAELADWYKREFPRALEQMLAMSGADLAKIVDFYTMKMPAVSYVMFCNNHMVHHRGQLATYLRPMGAKVPSIYGGSFDEAYQG